MRVEHGLMGCGGLATLVGAVLLAYVVVTWPDAPAQPGAVVLDERDLGPGAHRLGPYRLRPGNIVSLRLSGTIICRRFNHDSGSILHAPNPYLRIVAVARDSSGREVGRGRGLIGGGSCTFLRSVPADQDETDLECSTSFRIGGAMAEPFTVDLMLPAAARHQDSVRRMNVVVRDTPPPSPGGPSRMGAIVGSSCVMPFGLLLLLAGVLVVVLRRKKGAAPPPPV